VDERRRHRAAWRQTALLTALALVVGALAVAYARRAPDKSDLKIPVAELRSQSAELRLLDRMVADGIARRFVQAHAAQLGNSIDRSREELESEKPSASLAAARADALGASTTIAATAAALHDGRAPIPAKASAQIAAAETILQTIEERLRR